MKQVDGFVKAIHKRHFHNLQTEARLHDKELKGGPAHEDTVAINPELEAKFDRAMQEAQDRKREEMRLRNG